MRRANAQEHRPQYDHEVMMPERHLSSFDMMRRMMNNNRAFSAFDDD